MIDASCFPKPNALRVAALLAPAVALLLLSPGQSQAALLLSDNFNAADGTDLNTGLATRQGGSLATQSYLTALPDSTGDISIENNELVVDDGTISRSAVFTPDVDFAAGTVGSDINNAGGLTVSMTVNPVVGGAGAVSDWFSVQLGHTATSWDISGAQTSLLENPGDIAVIFRDNGQAVVFANGTSIGSAVFDSSPSGGSYDITIDFAYTDVSVGSTGTMEVTVDGSTLDLNGTAAGTAADFTWDADGTNYLVFEARSDPSTVDDLSISTIPEPGSLALISLGGLLMLRRSAGHRVA